MQLVMLSEGVGDFRAEFGVVTVGLSKLGLARDFARQNEVEGDGI